MPYTAWKQRSEQLGVFVTNDLPDTYHAKLGDQWHRIAVRSSDTPLIVMVGVHTPLRSVVSRLVCGSRVGCYANDTDDIPPFFRRLNLLAPGYFDDMTAAIYNNEQWKTSPIVL